MWKKKRSLTSIIHFSSNDFIQLRNQHIEHIYLCTYNGLLHLWKKKGKTLSPQA